MAFVIDEYGSFEGLITAADMLEAIVGEPDDTVADNGAGAAGIPQEASFVLDGLMPLDELMEKLSITSVPAQGTYHHGGGLDPWRCCGVCRRPATGSPSAAGDLRCWRWMADVSIASAPNGKARWWRERRDGRERPAGNAPMGWNSLGNVYPGAGRPSCFCPASAATWKAARPCTWPRLPRRRAGRCCASTTPATARAAGASRTGRSAYGPRMRYSWSMA